MTVTGKPPGATAGGAQPGTVTAPILNPPAPPPPPTSCPPAAPPATTR